MQVTKRKYQANGFLPFEKVFVCQSSSGTRNSLRMSEGNSGFPRKKLKISFINKKQYIEIFKWKNITLQNTGMLCFMGIT